MSSIRHRHGSPRVFLYAGARDQAEGASKLIGTLAQQHGWTLSVELRGALLDDAHTQFAQAGTPSCEKSLG